MRSRALKLLAAVLALACASAADSAWSHANGRAPQSMAVRFQPDGTETILVPVTFGLLISSDGGESFRWVCETAIGYTGMFDPDYAVDGDGALWANSDAGLRVSRDGGCSWATVGTAELGTNPFISEVEIGPDGRMWIATANMTRANDVHVSGDGVSFPPANLALENGWWSSVRTTAADPDRIYASGLRQAEGKDPRVALLRRSIDGGATWEELPVDGFAFGQRPDLFVVGVSPTDANLVFARTALSVENRGDILYRSTDGGATWAEVARFIDLLSAFHVRPDGQTVLAGSVRACPEDITDPTDAGVPTHGCLRISRDGGETWQRAAQEPRLACIGERSDGVLFGCGADFPPDNFAIGRSSDGETWEPVLRFQDTMGPLECEPGTAQEECAAVQWVFQCEPIGACPRMDAGAMAQDAGSGDDEGGGDGGCCRVGSGDAGWVPGLVVVLFALAWSRARRR